MDSGSTLAAIEAACRLHEGLVGWRRTDEALGALKVHLPGFSPATTLIKVAAVNALYFTNAYYMVQVSDHFANVLGQAPIKTAGPELVMELACVSISEVKTRTYVSLASKFAHFFIDEDRFPIYDKYVMQMVAALADVPHKRLERNYAAFFEAFKGIADGVGIVSQRRRIDRYLWIQGQYEEWKHRPNMVNRELKAAFERHEWPPRIS